MAYGVVHRFAGGTKEQYEASLAAVHPNGGRDLPEGCVNSARVLPTPSSFSPLRARAAKALMAEIDFPNTVS